MTLYRIEFCNPNLGWRRGGAYSTEETAREVAEHIYGAKGWRWRVVAEASRG